MENSLRTEALQSALHAEACRICPSTSQQVMGIACIVGMSEEKAASCAWLSMKPSSLEGLCCILQSSILQVLPGMLHLQNPQHAHACDTYPFMQLAMSPEAGQVTRASMISLANCV